MFKPRSIIVGLALAAVTAPSAQALTFDPGKVPPRTQMTVRYADGNSVSTGNSHESRPALSLAKLYLGMWVLKYGASEDKARVENMIRFSEDGTASDLERKYPQAIPSIIGEYRLGETHHNGYWGNTTTSTEDLTRFIGAISGDPAAARTLAPHASRASLERNLDGRTTVRFTLVPLSALGIAWRLILMDPPRISRGMCWERWRLHHRRQACRRLYRTRAIEHVRN